MKNLTKLLLLLVLMLLFVNNTAIAGIGYLGVTGTLAGKVIDSATDKPLIGVNIVFIGSKYGGTTDNDGNYTIQNIPAGRYIVQFSYIGYKKHTVQWVRISADERTLLNVELESGKLETEEVVVTAERTKLKMDITGTTHSVEAHQLETLPVDDFLDLVAVQPGVTRDLHFRGGRKTEIQYMIDGLPYTDASGGNIGGMIPKHAIQEMRIMTGGFDAEYGNAMSGIINIVTKPGSSDISIRGRASDDHYRMNPETNKESLWEFAFGGPLFSKMFNFYSSSDMLRGSTRFHKDFENFFHGPVVKQYNNATRFDLNHAGNRRLSILSITSYRKERMYEWRWRRNLPGLPESRKFSNRLSLAYTQFLTDNSFFNLNVSRYYLNSRLGPDTDEELKYEDLWRYDYMLRFVKEGSRVWRARDEQTQWTFKGDLTLKPNRATTVKFGFQATLYDMDIDRVKSEPEMTPHMRPLLIKEPLDYSTKYNYRPRAFSLYLQDKIMFGDRGSINLGVRYEMIDPKAARPNLEWVPTGNDDFEKVISKWVPASRKQNVSPRVGFALALSKDSAVIMNYGHFYQVPLFDQLYSGLDTNLKKKNAILVGNPDMKPMITRSQEYIFRHEIQEGIDFSFTFFRKRMENLVDTKTFIASNSKYLDDGYVGQYVNSPYAESNGIEIVLEKYTVGPIYGKLSYTLMKAEGIAETENQELQYIQWGFDPVDYMYPLSWDQRHTIDAVISTRPTNSINLDLIVNYHTARPYTYFPSDSGVENPDLVLQPNNARMKACLYVDLKASRRYVFNRTGLKSITLYVGIRNLLDRRNELWYSSEGRLGGELDDPGGYDMPRRTRLGLEFTFR